MQLLKKLYHRLKNMARRFDPRAIFRRAWQDPDFLGGRYTIEDHSEVYLYSDRADLFPAYTPRRPLAKVRSQRDKRVTFVATARDEAASTDRLFQSLWNQSFRPTRS